LSNLLLTSKHPHGAAAHKQRRPYRILFGACLPLHAYTSMTSLRQVAKAVATAAARSGPGPNPVGSTSDLAAAAARCGGATARRWKSSGGGGGGKGGEGNESKGNVFTEFVSEVKKGVESNPELKRSLEVGQRAGRYCSPRHTNTPPPPPATLSHGALRAP